MIEEKKKAIILNSVLAALAIALIALFTVNELKTSGIIATSESKKIMKEFNKYYESKDRVIIYYASSNCGYCELQTPILEKVAEEYDIKYYNIDTSKLSKKQKNEIREKLSMERHATPTIVVVENGEVITTQVGYLPGSEFIEFLKSAELVPEDAVYEDEKYITFIDYSEYEKLIKGKGTNVITIGQTGCSHCNAIKPALNAVARDHELTMNYLNITDLESEDRTKFMKSLTDIKYNDPEFVKDGSFGTPLILVVKNGKVIHYISGERSTSQLVREFTKIGIIEGE